MGILVSTWLSCSHFIFLFLQLQRLLHTACACLNLYSCHQHWVWMCNPPVLLTSIEVEICRLLLRCAERQGGRGRLTTLLHDCLRMLSLVTQNVALLCRTAEVAEAIWAQTFKFLADNNVLFEGMLLKPSMVTPGADSGKKVNFLKTMLSLVFHATKSGSSSEHNPSLELTLARRWVSVKPYCDLSLTLKKVVHEVGASLLSVCSPLV